MFTARHRAASAGSATNFVKLLMAAALAVLFGMTTVLPGQVAHAQSGNQYPIAWTSIGIYPRQAPSMAAEHAGPVLTDGTLVTHLCETTGDPVSNGEASTDVWAKTEYGWLPTAWINTGVDGWTPGVPRCDQAPAIEPSTTWVGGDMVCAPYIVIAIPGSLQGAQRNIGKSDDESLVGPEVNAVVEAMRQHLDLAMANISYPATLTASLDLSKKEDRLSYYFESKNKGYAEALGTLERLATDCPSSKFFLVGFSQGAHIAGDLAQTVFHEGSPVDRSRIAGVILLADPAYNSASPGAEEFRLATGASGTVIFHAPLGPESADVLHGLAGSRRPFEESDPVLSICVATDPVCDGGSADPVAEVTPVLDPLLGAMGAEAPRFNHGKYVGAPIQGWGVGSLAEFAGSTMASVYAE